MKKMNSEYTVARGGNINTGIEVMSESFTENLYGGDRTDDEPKEGLVIRGLRVDHGSFLLEDVDLTVPQGTVMGLVGRNGAGKTTIIKSIAGRNVYRGNIMVDGYTEKKNRVKYYSKLGVCFDELMYNDEIKVNDFADIYIKVFPKFDEYFFNKYLDIFRVNRRARLSKLSFGMKKKFQITAVMSLMPTVLVLDEPTSGVDPADRSQIVDMVQDFMKDGDRTVLFSTHVTSDLDRIADYVTMIDGGKIIFSESKDFLQEKYRMVRSGHGTLDPTDQRLIGAKIDAFGVEALTDSRMLWNTPGVTAVIPTIEQVMLSFTQEREGR